MMRGRVAIALMVLAAVTACDIGDRDDDAADVNKEEDVTVVGGGDTAATDAPVSILRPEIEGETTVPPVETRAEPLNLTIAFPDGGSDLDAAALSALERVLASPQIELDTPIVLRAHSDSSGSDAANRRASAARAATIEEWLITNDVAEERIETIIFAGQNPVEPNALPDGTPNEAGRARNRRVEIAIGVPGDEGTSAGDEDAKPTGDRS